MADYIGAIDSGTTSTRFMLFDQAGAIVGYEQQGHEQIFPRSGWVEHDPLEIWQRTQAVIRVTLAKCDVHPAQIAAVGITNQRETAVMWDRHSGEPVYNAIVWQDTRTDRICRRLEEAGHAPTFQQKAGLPLATYFTGPKIRWILENVEGAQARADAGTLLCGTLDSWLIWQLSGGAHVTDPTNASRTMLMDLVTLTWDAELLEILEIPRSLLPEIRPSSDPSFYGRTTVDGPFGGVIPICGDLGDQQAATVGQTCFSPGEAKNTYGTGCFMILNTGEEIIHSRHGLLTTVCYQMGGAAPVYALEGSIAMAGATVQWLRDNLRLIDSAAETEEIAKSVADTGGCYLVPAFSGLFAPHWRSDARGVLVGLTRYVNRAHIVRAGLESICYQTREVLDAMNADSGRYSGFARGARVVSRAVVGRDVAVRSARTQGLSLLKVDGGATVNDFLMQLQADILGVDVVRPRIPETTSLGAAYAAGLAVGFWPDLESLRRQWRVDKIWRPQIGEAERTQGYAGWQKAVERTLGWA